MSQTSNQKPATKTNATSVKIQDQDSFQEAKKVEPNLNFAENEKKAKKPKRRRQRRRPKRKKSKQRFYFTDETQDAIVRWQKAETQREKDKIFTKHLHSPLLEIARSLINVYNLADYHEREEVAHDCATNLFESLDKFDAEKGHKAFSYFSVVARHWLISERKKRRKEGQRMVHYDNRNLMDEESELSSLDIETLLDHQTTAPPDGYVSHSEFAEGVDELWTEMREDIQWHMDDEESPLSSQEISVLEACENICEHAEELDLQTRNAMRIYIQEFTGLSKKELSASIKRLKELYWDNRDLIEQLDDYWGSN